MTLYPDASAIVAVVVNEATGRRVDGALQPGRNRLLVSDFAVAETSSAVARLERTGFRSRSAADSILRDLDHWVVEFTESVSITSSDISTATTLIRCYDLKLRAPDAIHIAAAARLEATLVTLDRGMARAATVLGLPCINPAETSALKD